MTEIYSWYLLFVCAIVLLVFGWLIGYTHCRIVLADKCKNGNCPFGRKTSTRKLEFSDEVLHQIEHPNS